MRKTNFIYINGEKFKALLEGATGKTLKELSLENGFSDSFLRMVVKTGKATPTAQAVAKLYGIEPSAYEIKPEAPAPAEHTQLSFEDIATADDARLKAIFKEAIKEVLTELGLEVGKEGAYKKPSHAIAYLKSLGECKPAPKSLDDFNK